EFSLDCKIDFFERLFLEFTLEADCIGRLLIDMQGDLAGRNIRRAAVQGQQLAVIHSRMSDPFVATARDKLIESFQPAQATTPIELDKCWIDDLLDRRIPPHAHIAYRRV